MQMQDPFFNGDGSPSPDWSKLCAPIVRQVSLKRDLPCLFGIADILGRPAQIATTIAALLKFETDLDLVAEGNPISSVRMFAQRRAPEELATALGLGTTVSTLGSSNVGFGLVNGRNVLVSLGEWHGHDCAMATMMLAPASMSDLLKSSPRYRPLRLSGMRQLLHGDLRCGRAALGEVSAVYEHDGRWLACFESKKVDAHCTLWLPTSSEPGRLHVDFGNHAPHGTSAALSRLGLPPRIAAPRVCGFRVRSQSKHGYVQSMEFIADSTPIKKRRPGERRSI